MFLKTGNISAVPVYIMMNFHVQDESSKCVLYVIMNLLILISKMNIYVQDESTKCMLYLCSEFYVHDASTKYMLYIIIHWLMSKMRIYLSVFKTDFYVEDDSTKCLLHVILTLLNLMSKMKS